MLKLNKHKLLLIALYILYKLCNLHIANCDGLTDVFITDLSKIDKAIGWTFIIGSTFVIAYLFYKGIPPTDDTGFSLKELPPILSQEDTQARDSKTQQEDLNTLKDSDHIKLLQELTKYN